MGTKDQTPGRSLPPAKSPRAEAAGAALRSGVRNWRNAVDLHHLPAGTRCLANRPGTLAGGHSKLVLAFGATNLRSNHQPAYRLTKITSTRFRFRPNWSAWGDLHSQGCSGLSRTGLLFPVNHTPVDAPGFAPGRLSDLKSLGSADSL